MPYLMTQEFTSRHRARRRRQERAKAAAQLAYTTQPPHDPTIRCRLIELPAELLDKIMQWLALPFTAYRRPKEAGETTICFLDEVAYYMHSIGLTCHRLHNLFIDALLTEDNCRIALPRWIHTHTRPTLATSKRALKKRARNETDPLCPFRPSFSCEGDVVDTSLFRRLATKVTIKCSAKHWTFNSRGVQDLAALILSLSDSLEKITIQFQYSGAC